MRVFFTLLALVLAVVFVVAVPHDHHHGDGHSDYVVKTHADLLRYREHCSHDIASDLVEKYKNWQYPDDAVTHCYMKCIFEQFGFFEDAHGFNVHNIHHQVAPAGSHVDHNDELHGKIAACAEKKPEYGDDKCKWAYNGGMCFIRQSLPLVKDSIQAH